MSSSDVPPNDGQYHKHFASSGQPFDIVEAAVDDVTGADRDEVSSDTLSDRNARKNWLGYLRPWNPIPTLKDLLDRLFPPR